MSRPSGDGESSVAPPSMVATIRGVPAAGVDGVEQRLRGREVGFFDVASAKEERAAIGGVGRLQLADPRAVELSSRDGLAPAP